VAEQLKSEEVGVAVADEDRVAAVIVATVAEVAARRMEADKQRQELVERLIAQTGGIEDDHDTFDSEVAESDVLAAESLEKVETDDEFVASLQDELIRSQSKSQDDDWTIAAFEGWTMDVTLDRRFGSAMDVGIRMITVEQQLTEKLGSIYAGLGPDELVVTKVENGGLVAQWNAAHAEEQVVIGDRLVRVNEEETTQAMKLALQLPVSDVPLFRLRFARSPSHFTIVVGKKDNCALGFHCGKRRTLEGSAELLIEEVHPWGALAAHNSTMVATCAWDSVVLPSMCLVAVNNIEDDWDSMIRELKSPDEVTLRICRVHNGTAA